MRGFSDWSRRAAKLTAGTGWAAIAAAVVMVGCGGVQDAPTSTLDFEGNANASKVVTSDPIPGDQSEAEIREFWNKERMRQAKPMPLLRPDVPAEGTAGALAEPAETEGEPIVVPPTGPGSETVPKPYAEDLGIPDNLRVPRAFASPTPGDVASNGPEAKQNASEGEAPSGEEKVPDEEKGQSGEPASGEKIPLAAPANDMFASASVLSGSSDSAGGTNVEASKEADEPNHAGNSGGASVWYRWQAPNSGTAIVGTCDSNFDTLLAVYTGATVSALSAVVSNDDSCGAQSEVSFNANAGTTYRIAVDGYSGATGAVALELDFYTPPANDNFANAELLSGSSDSASATNVLASKEAGEPNHAGNSCGASVWYRWQAPATEQVWIHTCDSDFDTLLAVYTGTVVSGLSPVASNDDEGPVCGARSRVSFPATAGTTYHIAVDGFSGDTGAVRLNLSRPTVPFKRYEITDPAATGPNNDSGKLFGAQSDGTTYVCSATAVNTYVRSVIFTAGHCVNDPPPPGGGGLGFASSLLFVPGYKSGNQPYGTFVAREVTALRGWTDSANFNYDLAAITLGPNERGQQLQDAVGARGIAFNQSRTQLFESWGYPARAPFDGERLYVCESGYGGDEPSPQIGPPAMGIGCDMKQGSSGGGWVIEDKHLNSVNSYGYADQWDVMYGPFFGNDAKALYSEVSGDPPIVYKARIGKVKVSGPAKVKRGRKATYKVGITNSGNKTATGVRLKVKGRGVSFNTSVGKIGAKKTRTVKVRLKAKKPGRVKVAFKVTSKNAGGKTVKKTITVKR